MSPVNRSWFSFFVDRLFGWWVSLPGETCSYTIESVRVPVGDNLKLAADLYRPAIAKPYGTILVRTSYGLGPMMALSHARIFAARGYLVLHAACRGTDPSDGAKLVPAIHEAEDGLATVRWMREQPWYTGSFGTLGGSYLGYTQWAILSDPPEDMKAAVISTGLSDFGRFVWGTGAMDAHLLAWADLMTAPKRGHTPGLSYIKAQPTSLRPVYDGVPMVKAIEEHFRGEAPDWLVLTASDPELNDPLFKSMDQRQALQKANLPILQNTGWNDMLLTSVVKQHGTLSSRACPAFMTIGPWSHLGCQRETIAENFAFLEEHLGGRKPVETRSSPVRAFVTGAKEWRDYETWPPSSTSTHKLFLRSKQTLSVKEPAADGTPSEFTFDPLDPTPNVGLPRPFDGVTPANYDDTALAAHSDVAVFTSEPLENHLEIIGQPSIEIHHISDNPNVDLLIRLSEVDGRGKSLRISDKYQRLDPNRPDEPIRMTLSDCAHRFSRGNKIRVIIAGGAHPGLVRNLGTGENPATGDTTRTARHVIHHDSNSLSSLSLPMA